MKTNHNRYLLAGVLGVAGIASAGLIAFPAFAYRGDASTTGPNYTPERHEAMEKAFETNDYEAWKSLMIGKGRVTEVINKDNFAKFAEMHRLREEGKTDDANKIRAELGLGQGQGKGKMDGTGQRGGKGGGMKNCDCQNQATE